jgi:hypothetical protein
LSELQHENEDLKASVREYKHTIEVIIEKHLTQMVRSLYNVKVCERSAAVLIAFSFSDGAASGTSDS